MRDHFWTDTHSGEQCVNCGVYGRTGDDPGMCPGDPTESENKQLRADLAAMTERAERGERERGNMARALRKQGTCIRCGIFDRIENSPYPELCLVCGDDMVHEFECPKALAAIAKERDAARADVERLRVVLSEVLFYALGSDASTMNVIEKARALLAETAPKGAT